LLRARFGLDQPILIQFLRYITGIFQWPPDFGVSYSFYPQTVFAVIMQRLPVTLFLVCTATLLTAVLGIVTGVVSATRHGSLLDTASLNVALLLWTVPYFWLAMILLWVFGLEFRWFPITGAFSSGAQNQAPLALLGDLFWHSTLPILTLVLTSYAGYMLVMRSTVLDVVKEDYVLLARAKGLKERTILLGYIVRNAMLPTISVIGLNLGFAVSGAVLTEIVFSYPGMGMLINQAVLNRDFPLLQGAFFVIAVFVIVANLLTDFAYSFLDPRVRKQ
jgi:peptide/nickel transport system permease protein